jgi:hypothetical protein
MPKERFYLDRGVAGTTSMWKILNEGMVVCEFHGPMSAVCALSAVETLNAGFTYDTWISRLTDELADTEKLKIV